jgi:hypothetical protein
MLTATTPNQKRDFTPPLAEGEGFDFDWAARLSIDIIRQHTKTDDIPGVTDEQLSLYRASAVEAAERYTGMLLKGQRNVMEPVQAPHPVKHSDWAHRWLNVHKPTYKHRLRYPSADGYIYLYGGLHPHDNRIFRVPVGTTIVEVPIRYYPLDLSNCCDPCSVRNASLNADMMVAYRAGYASPMEVPSLVILGCLQYIAWVLEHPGDEILTVRNRRDARSEGAQGTNNIAIASGALESWRVLVEDII